MCRGGGGGKRLTVDKCVEDVFPVPLDQVVDVSENSTVMIGLALIVVWFGGVDCAEGLCLFLLFVVCCLLSVVPLPQRGSGKGREGKADVPHCNSTKAEPDRARQTLECEALDERMRKTTEWSLIWLLLQRKRRQSCEAVL